MSFATLRQAIVSVAKAWVGCPSSFASFERSQGMKFGKHFVGIALFFIIFASSVVLVGYLLAPLGTVPSASPAATKFQFTTGAARPLDNEEAKYVSLDFINRESYTTLALEGLEGQPLPGRIWVRTYFFTPDVDRGRLRAGEPIEVRLPILDSDRLEVLAVAPCEWCNNSSEPQTGYYARVVVSTVSAEDTRLRDDQIDRDLTTATPVVVQAERKTNSFAAH
jgi:hypothetical protein